MENTKHRKLNQQTQHTARYEGDTWTEGNTGLTQGIARVEKQQGNTANQTQ